MKRSRTTALLLMSAAPLLFTACQKEPEVKVQEGLYTSVEACTEATGDPSSCRNAFAEAQKQAADAAPKYASKEACEKDYKPEQCVQQHTSAGTSFIGPMMMGFFMSQMLSNRGGLAPQAPAAGERRYLQVLDQLQPVIAGSPGAIAVAIVDGGVHCLDQRGLAHAARAPQQHVMRGMASGTLKVQILTEGVHSGDSSGVVPSSFRILRHLLDRLEDSATGRLLPQSLHCEIPSERIEQVHATARILGDEVWRRFPWSCGADGGFVLPMTTEPEEALLNRTWRPTLSVTGAEGLPPLSSAGNVLRPRTAFKLSLRLPPLVDAVAASQEIKALLEADAPYNAKVIFKANEGAATGWNAPASEQWLTQALDAASQQYYGAPCGYIGQGGTIPLMSILQKGFPKAQFMVCGVLGPKSNAHGPNEFLHVPYGKKLTAAVAQTMAAMPV